ncbi:recombinase family protein [Streptomyces sp. NPDC005708]|uniref:recombinase family protein n=1 Tax=Streptomyces sp. NPDC005708 TaxID=3154564 RepID=UPI0033DC983E
MAREYLRVSKGRGRMARSIADQHTENLAAEDDFGPWTWGEAYRDTGSASKFARKARDDFEKLLNDLRSQAFGNPGDVLVLWEISRLARETGKGVEIVDLCEAGEYLIHITSHERTYNPRNYNDRHELITGIAEAEKEARRLSARTNRGINSAAKEGRPHGRVPFGYARDYEVIDGRPRCVRQYPDPVTGKLILELFQRAAGDDEKLPEPIYQIAKDWEQRHIWIAETTLDGEVIPSRPYSPQHLRAFLVRPVYTGLRRFRGQFLPEWEGMEPIVSRELFDRVQAVLADPSRRTYMGGGARWALSMTMRADRCGGPMVVGKRKRNTGYECKRDGCCWISKEAADKVIIGDLDRFDPDTGDRLPPELGLLLAYLASPHRHAALRQRPDASEEEKSLRADLKRLNGELRQLKDAPKPSTALARIERTKDIEEYEMAIGEAEAQLRKLAIPAPLAQLLPDQPITDVARWWKDAGIEKQRAIAAAVLTPSLLGEVRITPSPGRKSIPVAERIVLRREAPEPS